VADRWRIGKCHLYLLISRAREKKWSTQFISRKDLGWILSFDSNEDSNADNAQYILASLDGQKRGESRVKEVSENDATQAVYSLSIGTCPAEEYDSGRFQSSLSRFGLS
jgi:hypothetical protein